MRKEIIVQDAGSHFEDWREIYVENLLTKFPKAIVLPMEHTISLSRRGQRVWIAMNKRNSEDIRVVTWTRSALVPLGIVFLVIGGLILISFIASYMSYLSYLSYYSYYSSNSDYYPPTMPYFYITPYVPFLLLFFGLGIGLLATNKTLKMQSQVLQIARDTWLSLSPRVDAKTYLRSGSPAPPPKTIVITQAEVNGNAAGNYCIYCGTRVEKAGARFCENCGKSLFI